MASKQVVLFFRNPDAYGWTERYWYSGPTDLTDINAALTLLTNARAQLMTTTCLLQRARISSSTPRDPAIATFNNGAGLPGTQPTPTASSEIAVLLLFQASGIGYNRVFLRGIPERVVQADSFVPDTPYTDALQAFFNVLLNGSWNVVGSLGGSAVQHPATNFLPQPPRGFIFTNTGSFALTIGQKIRLHNTSVPGYSGLKTVVQVPTPTTVVVGGAAPAAADPGTSAYFTVPGAFDNVIATAAPEKLSRRGAGRPFGQLRGRRATLYSLRR